MYERSATHVGNFRDKNNNKYEHVIHCHTDDRVECIDSTGLVVLKHTAACDVFSKDGERIGRWSMDKEYNWIFCHTVTGEEFTYGRDLLKAEMQVSKMYINGEF